MYEVQGAAFNVTHFELGMGYCLCGLWERLLAAVVGFRVALDSVKEHILRVE